MLRTPQQKTIRLTRDPLRVAGVSRDAGNEKSLVISLNRAADDDEMRAVHDALRNFRRHPLAD